MNVYADPEEEARARLRERQGAGARYDAASAPGRELLWARRGTAYFARKLNELDDTALDAPSRIAGWSRRHVIAAVGYRARALTRLTETARTGQAQPMWETPDQEADEIAFGATLPARALRYLFDHTEVHLNVEWRDLTDADWEKSVDTGAGSRIAIRQTPWMRAREIWLRAIALDNGGRYDDLPADLRRALLSGLAAGEGQHPLPPVTLVATDGPSVNFGIGGLRVTGSCAELLRWLDGGPVGRIVMQDGDLPALSRSVLTA